MQHKSSAPFPALLLEPNRENAVALASGLEAAGFNVRVEGSASAALQALLETYFFALIVMADRGDEDCLTTLETLRRRAPRSWMIVATPDDDVDACNHVYRRGGDAWVALPITLDDLISRLDAFQLRARPSF